MPTALITGGHSGIGRECSRSLVTDHGFDLVLAGRSPERMTSFADELRSARDVSITLLEVDLSSTASVRTAATRLRTSVEDGRSPALQALLLNAGAQFPGPLQLSADGYEQTFATNCLGPFLLLQLLVDCVSESGRIVFTASGTHDPDTVDGRLVGRALAPDADALAHAGQGGTTLPSFGRRYSTSKLCDVMYAYELDRRLRAVGDRRASVAFDPGSVPETGLLRSLPGPAQRIARTGAVKWAMRRAGVTSSSAALAGSSLARLAADPDLADLSGRYLQCKDGALAEARSSTVSYDEDLASALWAGSAELVHLEQAETSNLLRS